MIYFEIVYFVFKMASLLKIIEHVQCILFRDVGIIVTLLSLFRPAAVLPFTPYSKTLGGVVQELHRNLLVSITTERHPLTLTHVLKV